jgi:Mg/Co/Ni transporter MgtE
MPENQKQLLEQVGPLLEAQDISALGQLLSEQRSSDIAEIVTILNDEQRLSVFDVLDKLTAAEALEKVNETTGGIINPVLISVPEDAAIAEAINKIRAAEIDEDFFSIYVVDKLGRFVGDVRHNTRIISALPFPPNRYRPGNKFRPTGDNRERFNKRRHIYDLDADADSIGRQKNAKV